MKRILLLIPFLVVSVFAGAQSPSFKTYMNPVIPGDHPDCTVTRVGDDFYTTGSSFNLTPIIYHSTDLVHWRAIAQPVNASWPTFGDKPGGGCWGGHVVKYNGKWWHFFSCAGSMHFAKADNPEGPWATPVKINNPASLPYSLGYDNSVFIDDDNKWYLVVKNGQPNNGIVELNANGQPTGVVYNLTWLNPSPTYPYSWAEGPVLWKYKGYYYYSFARDLSGGQKVMRSKTLTADQASWEMLGDLFNESDPQKNGSLFSGPNHASPAVMVDDSTSWVIHPLYAKGEWRGQGRQGLLNQVKYNANGKPTADYPINQSFTAPKLSGSGIPWMVPKSDFFDADKLNPEWSFLGQTATNKTSLTDRPGWLRLTPKSTSRWTYVSKNDGEHNYSLITRIDFKAKSKDEQAGLMIMRGDETKYVKLVSTQTSTGKKGVVFSFENTVYETEIESDTLWLKMVRVNHIITGFFSEDGITWKQVGQTFNISIIDSYSDFSTWIGTRQGLFVQGATGAWFDLYIYRDAFTPILAECPANQSGTTKTTAVSGISSLDNIHNNDWALYAGVEFGDGNYYPVPDSVEFSAACNTTGGMIEVWLDSIHTGNKIAECAISATGNLSTYKSFKTAVSAVSGIHDVYLKFTGNGTGKLFLLKWITFSRKAGNPTSAADVPKTGSTKVFPNPADNELNIHAGFNFETVEILTIGGNKVYSEKLKMPDSRKVIHPNLSSGVYLLKITGEKQSETVKIIIN
jgi:beta-xylosidase